MSALSAVLGDLTETWEGLGFPASEVFAEGITADVVGRLLAGISVTPPQEAIDWFGWHDGVTDAATFRTTAAPSGFSLMSLEQGLVERANRLEGASEVAARLDDPRIPAPTLWRESWLPIGRTMGASLLVIEIGDGPLVPVYHVDWEDLISSSVPGAASLHDAVEVWLSVLREGYYEWRDGAWTFDFASIPVEWRRSRLVG